MDLYDDIDTKPKASQIDGWSSGIKMLQTQLAIKKAQVPKPKELTKKPLMTPVVNLKAKKLQTSEEVIVSKVCDNKPFINAQPLVPSLENIKTDDWDFVDEYDPAWPNEYEKLKEKRNSLKDKGREREERDRERNRVNRDERSSSGGNGGGGERDRGKRNRRNSRNRDASPIKFSGFGQRITEEERYSPPPSGNQNKTGGVAIAPPPSLQEISIANDSGDPSSNVTIPYSASSVAAKIMARYGFKDGQGLGKQEQGMSMALQVEKTSKRGGRIIHERDVFLPPPTPTAPATPARPSSPIANMAPPVMPAPSVPAPSESSDSNPSITEIMKTPSKVVLLRMRMESRKRKQIHSESNDASAAYTTERNESSYAGRNMVGPGDVDDELEPEVKDECNTKYGEVNKVMIHEAFGTVPEDAVKIFVEFKRMESAIKAVVDLNGRFFGGRQVRAGFYDFDKFRNLILN